MRRAEIRSIAKEIISNVAGIDTWEIDNDVKLREELMLDSLREMEIVARTELRFGISLDEDLLATIRTLEEYCDLIEKAVDSK
jgi:acyl carrier protein